MEQPNKTETKERPKAVEPVSKNVEIFMLLVVEPGVKSILEEKHKEVIATAKKVEEKYGSITAAVEKQREQKEKDPDLTNLIDLFLAERRLEKEVLPQGVATIFIHANAIVKTYPRAILESVGVFRSVVNEWGEENRINQTITDEHEKLKTKKEQRVREIQEILDLYQLTDEDSQQIMQALKQQQEFCREDIRKSAERMESLVIDTGPLAEKARIVGRILQAGAGTVEDRDEIKKLGGVLPTSPKSP